LNSHQETVRADLNSHQERAEKFQEIIRADLNSHEDKIEKFQESVRADLKSENEMLIQKFDQQTQATRKEFKSQTQKLGG
jgi:transketolase